MFVKYLALLAMIPLSAFSGNSFTSALEKYSWFEQLRNRGDWSSGGGQAVVCFDNEATKEEVEALGWIKNEHLKQISSVETLDLFEAKKKKITGEVPEVYEFSSDTFFDYPIKISERLESKISDLSAYIKAGSRLLSPHNIVFEDQGIVKVSDATVIGLPNPRSCLVYTMAVQVKIKDYFKLHIDERLFNHQKHSKLSKGVLMLHEYLYAQYRSMHKEVENSDNIRAALGFMITKTPTIKLETALRYFQQLGFLTKYNNSHPKSYYLYSTLFDYYLVMMNQDIFFSLKYYHQAYMRREEIKSFFKDVENLITEPFNPFLGITFEEATRALVNFVPSTNLEQEERKILVTKLRSLLKERGTAYKKYVFDNSNLLKFHYENILQGPLGDQGKVYIEVFASYVDDILSNFSLGGAMHLSYFLNEKTDFPDSLGGDFYTALDWMLLDYISYKVNLGKL